MVLRGCQMDYALLVKGPSTVPRRGARRSPVARAPGKSPVDTAGALWSGPERPGELSASLLLADLKGAA